MKGTGMPLDQAGPGEKKVVATDIPDVFANQQMVDRLTGW